jgi:Cdc6-like AAA superfamily ATPase
MTFEERLKLKRKVGEVFRPGTPIDTQRLFAGRLSQVNDVLNATLQPGRHVIMFGERGVGKTSLARIISEVVSQAGTTLLDCHTINCESRDSFDDVWRRVFREMSFVQSANPTGFAPGTINARIQVSELLPEHKLQADDIRFILSRIGTPSLLVIDEVDKLVSPTAIAQLADTIKTLSDHAVPTTLILIGVADYVEDLIAEHQSIERALVPVPMQRMSKEELVQIIDTGLKESGLTAEEGVQMWIATLSQGLPHYTHSLGLYAAFNAIDSDRTRILVTDVLEATRNLVAKSHPIHSAYNTAISSPQHQNLYAKVLRACALARTDELGYFRAADVVAPMSSIMQKKYEVPSFRRHLFEFCDRKRGPVLTSIGEPRSVRFRFKDPMMQPFVIIHDISIRMLTNELLEKAQGRVK